MTENVEVLQLTIFIAFLALVTVMGFMAARWRRGDTLMHLDEWGLGGRNFGSFVTWFLMGGDLYTAYTFIAVPAVVYASGAMGFWALPYAAIAYPIMFLIGPRLWSVSHVHGYVTPADFVRGRFGSRTLGLAVAITGIMAMMPYIALQLVGIQAVLEVMGVGGGSSNWVVNDMPLIIAFGLLAAYTYSSGLRAPALIAFVKDFLIYLVIVVAMIYIPYKLGGWGDIFDTAEKKLSAENPKTGAPFGGLTTNDANAWMYGTLALGSAFALFIYPHTITGALAARDRTAIKRNASLLPAYSMLLGLLALLGFAALAAPGVSGEVKKAANTQLSVPLLFDVVFPDWFTGVAFAAIGVGALVPAAIMSIAAANLFTRNIYREYIKPDATPAQETKVSQLASLVVKVGALGFVVAFSKTFAINLQLLGGIWITQTFPALALGLFTRWFHRWALLAGWACGMLYGTITAYNQENPATGAKHWGTPTAEITVFGQHLFGFDDKVYIALSAFALNLTITIVLTLLFRAFKVLDGVDSTSPSDYTADRGDRKAKDIPELVEK